MICRMRTISFYCTVSYTHLQYHLFARCCSRIFFSFFLAPKRCRHVWFISSRYIRSGIFTLWDKLVTLYECISIRLPLQCIKRYVVAVCLMHHMCPCSFRCRYVFMFRFEFFYSSESGWKCRSESQRFIFWVFILYTYRIFAEKNI